MGAAFTTVANKLCLRIFHSEIPECSESVCVCVRVRACVRATMLVCNFV